MIRFEKTPEPKPAATAKDKPSDAAVKPATTKKPAPAKSDAKDDTLL